MEWTYKWKVLCRQGLKAVVTIFMTYDRSWMAAICSDGHGTVNLNSDLKTLLLSPSLLGVGLYNVGRLYWTAVAELSYP